MRFSKAYWAILIIVLVATLFFVELDGELTSRDVKVISCDSGLCSDSEATSYDSRSSSLERFVAVDDASCSENVNAEAYLNKEHSYNKFYLYNRDVPSGSDLYSKTLGAHTGIYYELFKLDSLENKYFYTGLSKRVGYGDTEFFEVIPGESYRVDVYYCDVPLERVTCTDTDSGKYFDKKGVVTTTTGVFEDQCLANGKLLERFCDSDNTLDSEVFDCGTLGKSYSCNEGFCNTVQQETNYLIYIFIALVILLLIYLFGGSLKKSF